MSFLEILQIHEKSWQRPFSEVHFLPQAGQARGSAELNDLSQKCIFDPEFFEALGLVDTSTHTTKAHFLTVSQVRVVCSLPKIFSNKLMNTGPFG